MSGATQTETTTRRPNNPQVYIRRVLNLLYTSGSVVELRCLKTKYGTLSGYFNDFDKLAAAAAETARPT